MARRDLLSLPARVPALPRAGFAVGAVGVLLYAIVLPTGAGPDALRIALPPILYGLAAVLCLARVPSAGPDRSAWLLLGLGISLYGAGSVAYALAGERFPVGVPWPAHAGWAAFYLFAYAAIVVSLRVRLRALATSLAFDGLVGALTLTSVLAAVVVPSVVGRHGISLSDAAAGLAYPAADVLLIALVLCACVFSGWRGVGAWRVLAAGCLLLLAGDVLVDVQAVNGSFDDGAVVWAVFPAGMLVLAAAPWMPARRGRVARADQLGVLAVPALCFAAALGVQVVDEIWGVPELADHLSLVAVAAAAARAVLTHRELHRLREARRFERGFLDAEIGMVLIGVDGVWARVNDAVCRMLGRDATELVGVTAEDLLHPSDPGEQLAARERFAGPDAPRSASYEMVLERSDGRPVEVLVTTALVVGDDGEPWFFSQAQDITERNRGQRHSAALAELGRLAIETSDPRALTEAALRVVTEALPCDRCTVTADLPEGPGRLSVPLRRRVVVGDRVVAHRAPGQGPFDALDVRFLQGVGDVLAGALDRAEAERETRRQALHDPLTGLANRASLGRELDHALAVSEDRGGTAALILLDLDRFKVVNDTLGHGAGDELLQLVARRLLRVTGAMDVVARLGGDEFVVVCPFVHGADEALAVADRLIDSFETPFVVAGRELFVGASAGIAVAEDADATAESMVRDADVAMYRAKEDGGDRHVLFDAELRARVVRRHTLEHALRRALQRDELLLHYQPIVELATGRLAAFEALVRWEHPEHGRVAPGDFIPVAEDTGLIRPIGAWVLDTAVGQLAAFNREIGDGAALRMSVNLSPRQLTPDLPDLVGVTLDHHGVAPQDLVLEITESELVGEEAQLQVIDRLRELGVAIALDDFGTGFSSLASVSSQALDTVKLDRSLIAGLGTSRSAAALVRAVVDMTRSLGLDTVAEGLEEAGQLEAARDLGCTYGQGWHIARPMDAQAAGRLVADVGARRDGVLAQLAA